MPKWTPYISGERAVVVGGDYIYCYALTHEESVKFAAAHNADIDALTAERDEWRNAVIDSAVVNWTYTKEDEDNPYLAVCKLLGCAARDALDPQISLEAKALHDRIAELETTDHYQRSLEEMHLRYNAEAERDELQRRLDAVLAMWDMNTKPRPKHEDFHPFDYEQWNDAVCAWDRNASRYARARAIAEGREG